MDSVNLISVFRTIEFLNRYETELDRKEAMKRIQSDSFSFFAFASSCLFIACAVSVVILLIK